MCQSWKTQSELCTDTQKHVIFQLIKGIENTKFIYKFKACFAVHVNAKFSEKKENIPYSLLPRLLIIEERTDFTHNKLIITKKKNKKLSSLGSLFRREYVTKLRSFNIIFHEI